MSYVEVAESPNLTNGVSCDIPFDKQHELLVETNFFGIILLPNNNKKKLMVVCSRKRRKWKEQRANVMSILNNHLPPELSRLSYKLAEPYCSCFMCKVRKLLLKRRYRKWKGNRCNDPRDVFYL